MKTFFVKKVFLFSFFIFSFSFSKAQWVTIPDANFVAWLQVYYPSCMNGNLMDTTCSGIVNATTVTGLNYNVSDLTGIQYFDNLHFLNCSNLNISSLPPLPVFLDTLRCELNNIISLPNLPLTLTYLDCGSNQLTNLPSLSNSLNYLFCGSNQIVSLPPLPTSLQYLYCEGNLLTILTALPSGLIHLQCEVNQLSDLPTLPASLDYLDCHSNQITTLPFLPNTITSLSCNHNLLISLPTLPNSLTFLDCNYNSISSLPFLPNAITQIQCAYNQLTSLPNLPASLFVFGCAFNQLLSLPSFPSSLYMLDCRNNQLTGLPALPDSMNEFRIANNPDILCMPILSKYTGTNSFFWLANTGITCLPNFIEHYWPVVGIDTMPICDVFNTNGCPVGWNIQGETVYDGDGNCATLNDGVDVPMLKMNLYDSGNNLIQQVIANSGGEYSFDTQLGNYSTSADTANIPFNVLCPSNNSINSNLTIADSMDYNVDFRLKCKSGFDVGAWNVLLWNSFFPGESTFVYTVAGDYGQFLSNGICNSGSLNGEIKIVINGPANYDSSITGGLIPTIIGDTLVFSIPDFSLLNVYSDIAFNVTTDTTAQSGDIICFDISVTPTSGDNNISNNELNYCFVVGNSYDPNYKEVSPINIFNQGDWLNYTIHFQNTGTAAAQHIQILDTLDADLDASTFQLLSSSFDPMVQLFGSKVKFNFININLPDSTTNSEGSKGYVSYRIKPLSNLPIGTQIKNTASIYFDFNSPVVTNTTLNTVAQNVSAPTVTASLQINIYPNPVTDKLTIVMLSLSKQDSFTITVTDILGRELMTEKPNLNSTTLNMKSFSSGVYFVQIKTNEGVAVKKIIKN